MAVVYDPNKKRTQFGTPTTGAQTSGIETTQQPAQPKGSGSFTNLQKILGANVGAGSQMAQKVQSQATSQAKQLGTGLQQATQKVQSGIEQEKGLQSQAKDIGEAIAATKNATSTTIAENLNKLMGERGTAITGLADTGTKLGATAQQLENLAGKTATGLKSLRGTASGVGTETGRAQLLQNIFRRPGYTRGMSSLDQALMQIQGKDILQQTKKQLGQELTGLEKGQQQLLGLGKEITGLETSASDISKAIQGQLKGVSSSIDEELQKRAEAATNLSTEEKNAIINRFNEGKATIEDYAKLGIKPGTRLYNLDLSEQALKNLIESSTYGKEDVAKQSDVQAFSALRDILGAAPEYKPPTQQKLSTSVGETQKQLLQQTLESQKQQFEDAAKQATYTQEMPWSSMLTAVTKYDMNTILNRLEPYLQQYGKTLTPETIKNLTYQDYINIMKPNAVRGAEKTTRQRAQQYLNVWKDWLLKHPELTRYAPGEAAQKITKF